MATGVEKNRPFLKEIATASNGAAVVVGIIGAGILASSTTIAAAGLGAGYMALGFALIRYQSLGRRV